MFIRAQFTAQALDDLLRFRTISTGPSCPALYLTPPLFNPTLITRLRFEGLESMSLGAEAVAVNYPNGAPAVEHTFQRRPPLLRLRVAIGLLCLDGGNNPLPFPGVDPHVDVPVTADVSVALHLQNGMDVLSLRLAGPPRVDALVDLVRPVNPALAGLIEIFLPGALQAELSAALGAQQFDIGLIPEIGALSTSVGATMNVRHADVGFNPVSQRVEIRYELSDGPGGPTANAGDRASWDPFYADAFDNLAEGPPMAVFFDQRIGSSIISRVMPAEIDKHGGFHRDGAPEVSWDASLPGYRVALHGEVVDACTCLTGELDLDVKVSTSLALQLVGDRLRADVHLGVEHTDDWEVVCCTVTAALLYPIVGLKLVTSAKISWFEYLVGLAFYPNVILLFAAALARLSFAKSSYPQVACHSDPADSGHQWCEVPVPPLRVDAACGLSAELRLTQLFGRPDGLVIAGHLELPALQEPGIGIEVVRIPTYLPVRYDCSLRADSPERYEAELFLFRQGGTHDVRLCRVIVLGPLAPAVQVVTDEFPCPYRAWVRLSIPAAQYDGAPLKLVLVTSHGARHVTVAGGAVVSDQERQERDLSARIEKLTYCKAKSRRWKITWLEDPPPYERVIDMRRLWAFSGRASERTSSVIIAPEGQPVLAHIDTRARKEFRIGLLSPASALTLVQEASGDEESLPDSEIRLVQSLLGVVRQLDLGGRILALDAVRADRSTLMIYQEDRLLWLDASDPAALGVTGELDLGEIVWIGRAGGSLRLHDRSGRVRLLDVSTARPAETGLAPDRSRLQSSTGGGCGCGGGAIRNLEPEGAAGPASAATVDFDHVMQRGRPWTDAASGELTVRDGFQVTTGRAVTFRKAVARKQLDADQATIAWAAAAMAVRLGRGIIAAPSEDGRAIQLLRAMTRVRM